VGPSHPKQNLLFLHGIESHGLWFVEVAERLALRGIRTYLLDRRGSGLNRDCLTPNELTASQLLSDVQKFRMHLGNIPLHVLGLSWGGKLATAAVAAVPLYVRSLILVTPGLVPRVKLPFTHKLQLMKAIAIGSHREVPIPIEDRWFTRSPAFLDFLRQDPLRSRLVSTALLRATLALDGILRRDLSTIRVPVHLFLAENDRIIDNRKTEEMLKQLPTKLASRHLYEGATHSLQFDQAMRLSDDLLEILLMPGRSEAAEC
jgi:alpha-beta hydrolase superfamily lysophospholipase